MENRITAPTIGEILEEEFLDPMGISAYKLAREMPGKRRRTELKKFPGWLIMEPDGE